MRLTFPADELGTLENDVNVPVFIIDDFIDEADEEVFIIVLTVDERSFNAETTKLGRETSLCRIQDNDGTIVIILWYFFLHLNLL